MMLGEWCVDADDVGWVMCCCVDIVGLLLLYWWWCVHVVVLMFEVVVLMLLCWRRCDIVGLLCLISFYVNTDWRWITVTYCCFVVVLLLFRCCFLCFVVILLLFRCCLVDFTNLDSMTHTKTILIIIIKTVIMKMNNRGTTYGQTMTHYNSIDACSIVGFELCRYCVCIDDDDSCLMLLMLNSHE